jgi:uncharacterized lipoprotein YmbA
MKPPTPQSIISPTLVAALLAMGMMACQSALSRSYVLNAEMAHLAEPPSTLPSPRFRNGADKTTITSTSRPIRLGIAVTVPDYLDRTDIVRRTGENEFTTSRDAQWGESPSLDAARGSTAMSVAAR